MNAEKHFSDVRTGGSELENMNLNQSQVENREVKKQSNTLEVSKIAKNALERLFYLWGEQVNANTQINYKG